MLTETQLSPRRYYSPSSHGFEADIVQRLADLRGATEPRKNRTTSDDEAKDQKK